MCDISKMAKYQQRNKAVSVWLLIWQSCSYLRIFFLKKKMVMWSVQSAECNLEDLPTCVCIVVFALGRDFRRISVSTIEATTTSGSANHSVSVLWYMYWCTGSTYLGGAWMSQLCSTYLCPMNNEGLLSRRQNQSMTRKSSFKMTVRSIQMPLAIYRRRRTLVANWPLNYDSDYLQTVKHCHWTSWARHRC